MTTAMARETAEIPEAVDRLLSDAAPFQRAADRLARRAPPLRRGVRAGQLGPCRAYICAISSRRGSAIVVSATAPSIVTNYRKPSAMAGALFVVISQSGRSPDLVAATQAARHAGAITLALVNDTASPVAAAASLVIPVTAGPELAVAATKSVASLDGGLRAVRRRNSPTTRRWSRRRERMPARLANALELDWSAWRESLPAARAAFVAARGYGFGPAREIALKLSETVRLPALGYSAAELRHGPRAAIDHDTPVLALRQQDATADTVDGLVADLKAAGENVFLAGGPASTLPWMGDDHPVCDPVCMLVPAYLAIERMAREAGLDPDSPPYLKKVTETM